jgi:D-arabinose 1-dehydrogenase-like Zn-dependent alcohol dehydrogenase
VTGTYPGLTLPRVPGHEVVGRIDALGPRISGWTVGQRVGVGFFGGEDGTLIVVSVAQDAIEVSSVPLVFGSRSIHGTLTGTPIDEQDALAFSVLTNVRPMVETSPLDHAAGAYARMMEGRARFRMVLVP